MGERDWADGQARTMTVFLNGSAIPGPDTQGRVVLDDDFLVLFNADHEDHDFALPGQEYGQRWCTEVDTAVDEVDTHWHEAGSTVTVQMRSVVVLRNPREPHAPQAAGTAAAIPTRS